MTAPIVSIRNPLSGHIYVPAQAAHRSHLYFIKERFLYAEYRESAPGSNVDS